MRRATTGRRVMGERCRRSVALRSFRAVVGSERVSARVANALAMASPIAMASAIAFTIAAASLPAQTKEPFKGLDAFVQQAMALQQVPGLALAIVRNDSVLYLRGYGVEKVATHTPVDENTIFAIGSSTKAFTATLVALMVSDGRMRFDGKVSDYLPDFRLYDPYESAEVTIRDALAHRTSLPRADLLWYGSAFTRSEILHRFRFNEPDRSFRSEFVYNNVMVMAAGEAAARVAGTSWDSLVSARLFAPLHMTSSTTSIRPLVGNPRFAAPHMPGPDGPVAIEPVNIDNIGPAGSINSTARDMAQWLRFQLGAGVYDGTRLVDEGALLETHTPQMVRIGKSRQDSTGVFNTYGMGWFIERYRGQVLLQHGGEIDGFTAMVAMLPERNVGVVVLSNRTASIIPTAVMRYVFDHQLGIQRDWLAEATPRKRERAGPQPGGQTPAIQSESPTRLASYTGTYNNRMYGDMIVAIDGGKLQMTREGGVWKGNLEYVNATNFRWLIRGETGPLIAFDVGADGTVGALTMRMGAEKIEYQKSRSTGEVGK